MCTRMNHRLRHPTTNIGYKVLRTRDGYLTSPCQGFCWKAGQWYELVNRQPCMWSLVRGGFFHVFPSLAQARTFAEPAWGDHIFKVQFTRRRTWAGIHENTDGNVDGKKAYITTKCKLLGRVE